MVTKDTTPPEAGALTYTIYDSVTKATDTEIISGPTAGVYDVGDVYRTNSLQDLKIVVTDANLNTTTVKNVTLNGANYGNQSSPLFTYNATTHEWDTQIAKDFQFSNSPYHLGENTLAMTFSDLSGNDTTITLRVNIIADTTAPAITLIGTNPQTIEAKTTYSELGATVADNHDIGLTASINSSTVNTNVVGSYSVTYNAVDAAGNPATEVTRTVNVIKVTPTITWVNPADITYRMALTYSDQLNAIANVPGSLTYDPPVETFLGVGNGRILHVDFVPADQATYNTASKDVFINVARAPQNINFGTLTGKTYGDSDFDVSATGSDTGNPVTFTVGGGDSCTISGSTVHITGAGSCTVTAHQAGSGSYNAAPDVARTFSIARAALTASADSKTIDYGDPDPVFTIGYSGFVNGDDLNALSTLPTASVSGDHSNVGIYPIVVSGGSAASYDISYVGGSFTVANATINSSTTSVVISSGSTTTSTISVQDDVDNATINVSALTASVGTSTVATIQGAILVSASTSIGRVNVEIPAGIQITGDGSWTGIINLPQVKANSSVTAIPSSGMTANISSVVEVGFGDVKLTFDKAVKILLVGQAGKYAGYSRSGVFTQITNVCAGDDQETNDLLAAESECKIDVGSDLVIWTKHFTNFVIYTQSAIPAPVSLGGGGGPGPSGVTAAGFIPTAAPAGQVLGASTFNFTVDLSVGSRGNSVIELQSRLTREGVYFGHVTGYFGSLTLKAVRAYQSKLGISATGLVGPLTRAQLNGSQVAGVSTVNAETTKVQIATLQAQLVALLQQLLQTLQAQAK
jgi:hypothetical protein